VKDCEEACRFCESKKEWNLKVLRDVERRGICEKWRKLKWREIDV